MAIVAVHQDDKGPKVDALHEGLLYLIEYQGSLEDETRSAMKKWLAHDLIAKSYGTATAGIVGIYQYQIRNRKDLPDKVKKEFAKIPLAPKEWGTGNGDVDKLTAKALNWLIDETRAHTKE